MKIILNKYSNKYRKLKSYIFCRFKIVKYLFSDVTKGIPLYLYLLIISNKLTPIISKTTQNSFLFFPLCMNEFSN